MSLIQNPSGLPECLQRSVRLVSLLAVALACGAARSFPANAASVSTGASGAAGAASVAVVFSGSTLCDKPISTLLELPAGIEPPLRWQLTLHQDSQTKAPARYELQCEYDVPRSDKKKAAKIATVKRAGAWTIAKGTKSNPAAIVYELQGLISLVEVDPGLLHVLNADRSLMLGNGGWSYTLNRADRAEKPTDPALVEGRVSKSYKISSVSTGPTVFGVFEGRTPYEGITRELRIGEDPPWIKAKWRVTLYQDAKTHAPTTYKVEGTLYHQPAREGNWTILEGTATDPKATVFRLDADRSDRTAVPMFLLKGDDNVLFFMNRERRLLVGHALFSYTLNRRDESPAQGTSAASLR